MIDFQTGPGAYRHWRIRFDGPVAYLVMDVDEAQPLFPDCELKRNSYDLGVDIELYDAVQRLRFEHPEIRTVVLASGKDGVFCSGANIRMLGAASHAHKVNFCKFTNETRNAIEDASEFSGQRYLAVLNGSAAGGGYELAMAADYIVLVDDGSAAVSLPELPLLAVLPGTGGLTRLIDKRKVRRDLADIFCTTEEGISGRKAVDWRLVDECVTRSSFEERVAELAQEMADTSDRPAKARGIELAPLNRSIETDRLAYDNLVVELDRQGGTARFRISGPTAPAPGSAEEISDLGGAFWPLALARELDDAILHLRLNELGIGIWIFESEGDLSLVSDYDALLHRFGDDWLVREVTLYWKRTLKRLDVSARSLIGLVGPGSCFAGMLAEILFAADRTYMLEGGLEDDDRPAPRIQLSASNFGRFPAATTLSRLAIRFYGDPDLLRAAEEKSGTPLDAGSASEAGLVTYALDFIDWDDEIRLLLEERRSFSPDALSGMEANLRFVGPETMESKIFGRLSAWQNWIFQRPNAVGEQGALKSYGTGARPQLNAERV